MINILLNRIKKQLDKIAEINKKIKINPEDYRPTSFPGYLVNRKGEVFSERRNVILSPRIDKDGYSEVSLMHNGKAKAVTVHRLIAEAWIPNPENKPFVNHKNGNRGDNRVSNLEWVTVSENNLGINQNQGKTYVYDGNRINREKSHLPPITK